MSQIDGADWMGLAFNQNPAMADIPLCRLPLPGSHDAGSYGGINVKSKTQHKSIKEQLEAGVRYFDLRVRVDNGLYFSHHGSDESRDNKYTDVTKDAGTAYIFDEIEKFCRDHWGEVVILNFQDFTSVWHQSFNADDAKNFIACIKRDFGALPPNPLGTLLYPYAGMPTYGQCLESNQRILVIFNDGGEAPLRDAWIWPWKNCLRDRFSDYKYWLHGWDYLVSATLEDQQNYLAATTGDSRDLSLFWVSQAILGYSNVTTPDGGSQNKAGAQRLNPVFTAAYKLWWTGKSAVPGNTQTVQQPNILLMDYSGVYDDFATECYNLLT